MKTEFIPYEQALELKELGFDESTYAWRQHGNGISADVEGKRDYYNRKGDTYTALPTFSQAFRWFREKHKLVGLIEIGTQEYSFIIFDEFTDSRKITSSINGTYEEAELECLKKLIEIVKNETI